MALRTDRPVGTGGGGDIWQLLMGAHRTGSFIPIMQFGPKRQLVPVSWFWKRGEKVPCHFFFFFNPFIVQIFISTEAVTLKAAFEERDKGGQAW